MRVTGSAGRWTQSLVYALSCGLSMLSACKRPAPSYVAPQARPITAKDRQVDSTVRVQGRARWLTDSTRDAKVVEEFRKVRNQGRLSFDIEEVDDEQGFATGPSASPVYGPVVYGAAISELQLFKTPAAFESGSDGPVVAGLYLAQRVPAAESAYGDLRLSEPGLYCVYLHHVHGPDDQGWGGHVTRSSDGTSCSRPAGASDAVTVAYRPDARHPRETDFPAVARFGTDVNGSPLLIVRCGAAECYMKAGAFSIPSQPNNGDDDTNGNKKDHIRLWQDDQRLAVKDANGILRPKVRAVVTPFDNLENMQQDGEFKNSLPPVAWVWLEDDPTNTKYATVTEGTRRIGWGMVQGWNLLRVGYDSTTDSWIAQIDPYGKDRVKPIRIWRSGPVYRTKHVKGANGIMPGTARFAWFSDDEGLWVSCDMGCCRVSAADFVTAPPL